MNIKTIKRNVDTDYTKYVFREIDLIKDKLRQDKAGNIFFLGYFHFGQVILIDGSLIVANIYTGQTGGVMPDVADMKLTELHRIRLLKEYPVSPEDIECEIIIANKENIFSIEKFLFWIDEPCDITYEIDVPYYKIIKFLKNYTKETFKTKRYLFYSKRDDDYSLINNIYAYDLKKHAEMKLYTFTDQFDNDGKCLPPQKLRDIVIEDLSGKLSGYQLRQCKKEFIKLANKENLQFNVNNYWVMELVKLAIQPVLVLHEWSIHRCFCKPKLFGNIWVYDFPKAGEEPSFMLMDNYFTKVAVLSFLTPSYLIQGIYKRGMAKAKIWQLNKQEIQELISFLQAPSNQTKENSLDRYSIGYKKYVKTNWQQLIFEYNHNSAGWGWGNTGFDIPPEKDTDRDSDIEVLPFDLPIPNYTKLLNG